MSFILNLLTKMSKRFGIYFVYQNKSEYVLKGNSPIRMIGYIMNYYTKGLHPSEGWVVYFSSAATKKHFEIGRRHFTDDGESVTQDLKLDLDEIDERWSFINGPELEFMNCNTNQKIKIQPYDTKGGMDKVIKDMMSGIKEENMYSILDKIFTK